jgi:hypothetical protein
VKKLLIFLKRVLLSLIVKKKKLRYLKDELFLVRGSALEGLGKDGRPPAALATKLCEGGHGVLSGQVFATRQRYHTLQ